MPETEKRFLARLSGPIPDAGGYRSPESRRVTDEMFRRHVASELERLREKFEELKAAAEDEGEEDMLDDLERIDSRMVRTASALQAAGQEGVAFFGDDDIADEHLGRVYAYDLALLEDVDLLITDVTALKYETIGNLTLREIEGTLAAIELKVSNRRDILESPGRD